MTTLKLIFKVHRKSHVGLIYFYLCCVLLFFTWEVVYSLTVLQHLHSDRQRGGASSHGSISHNKERVGSMREKLFEEILRCVIVYSKPILHVVKT